MFVDGPQPVDQRGVYAPPCTTSNAWPVVDTLWTANFLLNLAVFGSMSDEDLQRRNISRDTAVGLNVGLAALALSSAIAGFNRVGECREQVGELSGRGAYSRPQRFIAPPRATRRQEEAEEEAAVQARMRARSAQPAAADETDEGAPAVAPAPPAPAAPPPPTAP